MIRFCAILFLLTSAALADTWFVVYDGKDIGKEYDRIQQIKSIDGKLAYMGQISDPYSYEVIYNGNKIAGPYTGIEELRDLKGKLLFRIILSYDPWKEAVFFNGQQIGGEYETTLGGGHSPVYINGKIAFNVNEGCRKSIRDPNCKQFIVYDGKEIGKEYDLASVATNVGEKLAFIAQKNDEIFVVIEK